MPRQKGWFKERFPLSERLDQRCTYEPNTGCWLWTGAVNNNGYGVMTVGWLRERYVHRISWIVHRGPIPPGVHVLHRCNSGSGRHACLNPDHMYLGTVADNTADKMRAGRARGPKKWSAKRWQLHHERRTSRG